MNCDDNSRQKEQQPLISIVDQLRRSHLLIAGVGLVPLALAMVIFWFFLHQSIKMAEQGIPLAQTAAQIESEIYQSMAALRGYTSIKKQQYLREWQSTWDEGIHPTLKKMQRLCLEFEQQDLTILVNNLQMELRKLYAVQWWTQAVAYAPGNNQAQAFYLQQVLPVAERLQRILKPTNLADQNTSEISIDTFHHITIRQTLFLALLQLEKIIFEDKKSLINDFRANRKFITKRTKSYERTLFAGGPQTNMQAFSMELQAYERLSEQALTLYTAQQPPRVVSLFKNQVLPLSHQVIAQTQALTTTSRKLLQRQSRTAASISKYTFLFLTVSFPLLIMTATVMARRQSSALAEPITLLADAAHDFSTGTRSHILPEQGAMELAMLTRTYNQMRFSVEKSKNELTLLNTSLEEQIQQQTQELRKEKESTEKYLSVTDAVIVSLDTAGRIQILNRRGHELLGYPDQSLIGINWFALVLPAEKQEAGMEEHRQVMAGTLQPVEYFENDVLTVTGEIRRIYWHNTLLQDVDDRVSGSLSSGIDITKRKETEQTLQVALQEKESLLREIHHRVKNNMQVIISLLRLQAEKIGQQSFNHIVQESENRIHAMALVHEKLYRSTDISAIDLQEYIDSLCRNLYHAYGISQQKVGLRQQVADIFLDIEVAIPLGLLINELISNSLKYAFPEGRSGNISITVEQQGENLTAWITDEGVGMANSDSPTVRKTLGLELVTILTRHHLDGELQLLPGPGTGYRISFPHSPRHNRQAQ